MSWFSRWFGSRSSMADEAADPAEEPAGTDEIAELADLLQKFARTQARQGMRLEEIESKLEAGFSDLRTVVTATVVAPADLDYGDCFDAMDALGEAARMAPSAEYAQGMQRILDRLDRFLTRAGYQREAVIGQAADPRRFRTVGTEVNEAQPAGTILRVVRAAVLSQGKLVREGEVIVNARPQ